MKYYLLTSEEYNNHVDATDQQVVWSLDNSRCIIEVENDYTIANSISEFATANLCNDWRFDPATEEWRNWITEEDYFDL